MPANLTKSKNRASGIRKNKIWAPGIDSKTESKKLCQYFNTILGSEKIRDKNGPKLDWKSTCLRPIKAKMDRKTKTKRAGTRNPRCFLATPSRFSSPKRFMMREKRPRGGVAGEICVNIRLSSRIDSNTSYLCVLVH